MCSELLQLQRSRMVCAWCLLLMLPFRATLLLLTLCPLLLSRSPGRMGRLLRVVRAALPASEEQQAGGTAGAPTSAALPATAGAAGQELWRQHAEYEGAVKVLTWGGIGYASASWCPRYGVLYQVIRGSAVQ